MRGFHLRWNATVPIAVLCVTFTPQPIPHPQPCRDNNIDICDLELYFVATHEILGEVREDELCPGGRDVKVTDANKLEYIR